MRGRGALNVAALLASSLWVSPLLAKKDQPDFHVTTHRHAPDYLSYLENSNVILYQDVREGNIYRSDNAGTSWGRVEAIPNGKAARLVLHEYDSSRAYVMTEGITHYQTQDRGKTWETFMTDSRMTVFQEDVLDFHSGNPDHIIFNGMDCESIFCEEVTMYTLDGFKSDAKFLRGNTAGCWWAKSSHLFTTGEDDLDSKRILCIVRDSMSPFKQDQRLLISDNYFSAEKADGKIEEFEPDLDMNRKVQGVVNVAVVKKYLLVATTSLNTDEMALFVTDDTKKWHRAVFPEDHKLNQEAYTVLESTPYSIQIDVLTTRPSNPMGVMFTSNSNGTYFTRNVEATNRNHHGHVDFERVAGIQGIFLVNKVENADEVSRNPRTEKEIFTEITFDDGRTFSEVKAGDKRIHLHSVTDLHNVGRVFSSPAPGLLMAVGNTGKYLDAYDKGNLYVSDDAGVTWTKGLEGPYKYEFGDQGSILLAVKEDDKVGEIKYSLNHGKDWKSADLPDGLKIKPWILTTTQDSSSLQFVLIGETADGFALIGIDFEGLHEATCKKDDMEDWWARRDDNGDASCLMGHTQKFHRRKKDAECFLKEEFKDPQVTTTDCDCDDKLDFECDYNFRRVDGECKAVGPIPTPEGACKKADDSFKGSSGWRLIPGNTCKRTGGKQKDDLVDHKCSESTNPPPPPMTGKVAHKITDFKGDFDGFDKYYLERGDKSEDKDETIIMRPIDQKEGTGGPIWITHDHGKTWNQPKAFEDENIWAIIPHQYFKEAVYFVTQKKRVYYSVNYGKTFHDFDVPYPPDVRSSNSPLAFHPDKKDWLLWVGKRSDHTDAKAYLEASYSKDRGDHWETMVRYAERCEFIGSSAYKYRYQEEILCLARTREDSSTNNPLRLVASNDFFDENEETRETDVKDFATMAEFIVVATEKADKNSLQALVSLDGVNYTEAKFPYEMNAPEEQRAYTVLDSSTHAVNLFVVTETAEDRKYGTIIKSNSNGTSYVMSIAGVNCNKDYYVDFEKMLGLEGVVMVNVVANRDDKKAKKQLQTKISHNDGAEWAFLPPPEKDADGKGYDCHSSKGDENCALHIHGYTEREDHRKTYSSEGAVGLMFGVGNVGSKLGDMKDADTFMTTDAGITWKNVKKGVWTWQFGDQGSIIVLAQRHKKTKQVFFTTDEGATWTPYDFSDDEVEIQDVTTVRSGASRNFLLWCKKSSGIFTVNLDFSGLTDRACDDTNDHPDYYLWSPKHPMMPDTTCLFGHTSQYLRKKTDKQCFNGYKLRHVANLKNCSCTRRDFECDYNFELGNHGECALVQGFEPLSREEWCSLNPGESDYYAPTGYRRIPLTTCEGGRALDKQSEPVFCPNHEDEFNRKHSGPGGVALFFAITVPIGVAAAVGWYVYRNWSGKIGTIRLGDQGSTGFSFDNDSPWVRYPVIALSATVAVIGAIPLLLTALWQTATGAAKRWGFGGGRGAWSRLNGDGTRRFTTRDSFARGGNYDIVDEDEGELLGDDSDEEV